MIACKRKHEREWGAKIRKIGILLLAGCALSICAEQSTVEVQAFVSPALIHIGDLIHYTLVVRHEPEMQVILPEVGENLAGFSVREFTPRKSTFEEGRKVIRQTYLLNTFLSGNYIIPPAIVRYGLKQVDREIASGAVYVRVDSRLNAEENDIRDIAPPHRGNAGRRWPWC